ncbi:hypothetical protein L1987_45717 [Smallanthus sonchifolius]|uniref:Uncharacterized protein n=1 Tax=Smallanthus sonchifolius TaxID=185202 RepID=A0ACB9FXR3_9ASTR|nr:hypothetical protein L1987_45717 [Smallanthus sonchifolius]
MDSKRPQMFSVILLVVSSILCFQSRADGTGSVYFLDSSTHNYFKSPSSESKSISLPEVGAAVSVLLGFAPPSTLSSTSSEKLNEVLIANPFNRPHAVFLLEISGFGDKELELGSDSDVFSKALKSEIAIEDADIQLSDEDELSLVSLNEPLLADMEFTDTDLTNFASWFGGSYVNNELESLSGELTIPLANDAQLKLHMSKKADRKFIASIISLIHNVKRAIQVHEDLVGSVPTPAELINGRFDGFKAFQEHYGTDDIVPKGAELLVTSISKIYDSLQTTYKGEIVWIVVFTSSPAKESNMMLNIKLTTRASPRWLEEEKEGSRDAAARALIAEVLLVRRTLAWITGIILIIATLMGIWFLMYMPLTKDTLLYSNVKLD